MTQETLILNASSHAQTNSLAQTDKFDSITTPSTSDHSDIDYLAPNSSSTSPCISDKESPQSDSSDEERMRHFPRHLDKVSSKACRTKAATAAPGPFSSLVDL